MLNFVIKIEQGSQEYDGNNLSWTQKIIDDIILYSKLTDSELQQYTEAIREAILRNYFSGNTFTGGKVAALSPTTIKKKGHGKVFFDTGELYRSLVSQKVADGYEIFFSEGRSQIAYWLQTGTSRMPARPAFGIQPERADVILNSMLSKFHYGRSAA